jgi:hypothetical protein
VNFNESGQEWAVNFIVNSPKLFRQRNQLKEYAVIGALN